MPIDHAADDVDERDQQPGDGVAAHEFRGAVHGAEEGALVLELAAPPPRFLLVDQPGGQVGVDRHLLARHGVEVEARRDLGDAAEPLVITTKFTMTRMVKTMMPMTKLPPHHEVAERLDDVAGGARALVPVRQDQAGRGEVEREPQHGGDQQDGRERGELERRVNEQRRHQDQHREDDGDREEQVEQDRRQRQDEDHQDGHHADGERDVAALEQRAEVGQARQTDGAPRSGLTFTRSCRPNRRPCCAYAPESSAPRPTGRREGKELRSLPRRAQFTRGRWLRLPGQILPSAWLAPG